MRKMINSTNTYIYIYISISFTSKTAASLPSRKQGVRVPIHIKMLCILIDIFDYTVLVSFISIILIANWLPLITYWLLTGCQLFCKRLHPAAQRGLGTPRRGLYCWRHPEQLCVVHRRKFNYSIVSHSIHPPSLLLDMSSDAKLDISIFISSCDHALGRI